MIRKQIILNNFLCNLSYVTYQYHMDHINGPYRMDENDMVHTMWSICDGPYDRIHMV